MSRPDHEVVEVFLQEAAERLQFLREYSGILQDAYPAAEDVERLYIAAHTLTGTSASFGFPLFAEVSGKLGHIFQYAQNASISPDAAAPLVEFISEAVAVLESDLLFINDNGSEAADEIASFKEKYPFAFQVAAELEGDAETSPAEMEPAADESHAALAPELPPETEVPAEILEFFVPEAEEHLQTVTDCLLALEANPNEEDIHRLFRAMHTIKGSAAQVGLQRIAMVAIRLRTWSGGCATENCAPAQASSTFALKRLML
jgi:chemotaxis protein histidine kinase CheA